MMVEIFFEKEESYMGSFLRENEKEDTELTVQWLFAWLVTRGLFPQLFIL